jgi:TnpA family transposase
VIGQLEKAIFILELLLDPQLRRRQERGLNDMEAVKSASRAIFIGQRGEFRDRATRTRCIGPANARSADAFARSG